MSVNKAILIGNVGKDPEVRYLENNLVVCKFPLATSETYRNKSGEMITTTEWHNVVLWNRQAEVAEKFVTKGKQLYIEGKIRTRSYDDKDGNKKYITEIVADVMQFLGKKGEDGSAPPQQQGPKQEQGSDQTKEVADDAGEDVDDLPF